MSFQPHQAGKYFKKYYKGLVLHNDITLVQDGYLIEFKGLPSEEKQQEAPLRAPVSRIYLNQDLHDKQLTLWKRRFADRPLTYQLLEHTDWQSIPGLPVHLGAYFHDLEHYPWLADQLDWLQQKCQQPHYRFLILASDGGLGDTVMKTVAYRHLMNTLAEHLPDFSVDFAAMTLGRPLKTDQLRQFPERQRILTAPVTVEQLLEYDGVFDLTGALVDMKPGGAAFVDRLLNWLGLNAEKIPAEKKRNRLVVTRHAWDEMAARLHTAVPAGQRRIVFVRKASCRLRTFPQKAAAHFVRKLLDTHEDVHVLVPQSLPLRHPRLTVMGQLPTYHHLSALIGLSDGLITVDSFAQHAADALGIPTVTLSSSIDIASYYPYYPHLRGVMIPDAERLPLYNLPVETDSRWKTCASDYEAAWSRLNPKAVMETLQQLPKAEQKDQKIIWLDACPLPRTPIDRQNCTETMQQRALSRPEWLRQAERAVVDWAEQCLLGNGRLIWVAPGDTPETITLGRITGSGGSLTLYEPRQLLAHMQQRMLERWGETNVILHEHIPGREAVRSVRHLPQRPQPTLAWGNSRIPDTIKTEPWQWNGPLHGIIIYPPADPVALLRTFQPALSRGHVMVVLVAERRRALYPAARMLQQFGYVLAVPAQNDAGVILALSERAPTPKGWYRLNIGDRKQQNDSN